MLIHLFANYLNSYPPSADILYFDDTLSQAALISSVKVLQIFWVTVVQRSVIMTDQALIKSSWGSV